MQSFKKIKSSQKFPNLIWSSSTWLLFVRFESSSLFIFILSHPVKYFYWPFKGGASFVDHLCYFCLVFVMLSCASVYWCLVVTCWERADLLALVCDVWLWSCLFPIGILDQVWCLIVMIPYLCPLSYYNFQDLRHQDSEIERVFFKLIVFAKN